MVIGKMTKEQIIKGLQSLSDEERAAVIEEAQKPVEPTPEAVPEVREVYGEQPVEETADPVAEEEAKPEEPTAEPEAEPTPEADPVATPEVTADPVAEDNKDEVIKGLTDRVNALEEALKQFDELKARMEEFTAKQAESFGYKGQIPSAKKSMNEMSAADLKTAILSGK